MTSFYLHHLFKGRLCLQIQSHCELLGLRTSTYEFWRWTQFSPLTARLNDLSTFSYTTSDDKAKSKWPDLQTSRTAERSHLCFSVGLQTTHTGGGTKGNDLPLQMLSPVLFPKAPKSVPEPKPIIMELSKSLCG